MSGDLIIHGASDDLVCMTHGDAADEYLAYDGATIICKQIGSPHGCVVRMETVDVGGDPCWSATVHQTGEGYPIPWPVEIQADPDVAYSVRVTVRGFDGTVDVIL